MDGPSNPDDICTNCGTELHPSDKYCPSCGAATAGDEQRAANETGSGRQPTPTPGTDAQPDQANWDGPNPEEGRKSGPGAPGSKAGSESPFRAIGAAAGLSIAGLGVPLVAISILGAILIGLGLPSSPVLVVMVLLQFGWFVALGLWYLRRQGYDWPAVRAYLGVEWPTLKELGLIVVTWLGMIIVAVIVATILMQFAAEVVGPENAEPAENSVSDIIEQNPEIVFFAIAGMFLVVGPAEEILFRGVIQNRLRESLSTIPGIAVASLLFASAHVFALAGGGSPTGIAITMSGLFVTSLGLGWIYEYTENIVIPALLHGFNNSVIVAATAAAATSGASATEAVLQLPELFVILLQAL